MAHIADPSHAAEAALVRALGVRQLTAAIVNTTIGAGIFVLPALVAQSVGTAAPLAFLICAAIMALVTIALAVAGSRVAVTGGIYAYVEAAFGPYLALLAGVLQAVTGILSVSGVSAALLDQLGALAPVFRALEFRVAALAAIVGTLAYLNVRGVRVGTRLIEVVTAAKLTPLCVFVIAGVFFVGPSAAVSMSIPDSAALGRSVLILIFAYAGVEVALAPSGEVRSPASTVPRAVFLALLLTTSLYIAIQLVAQGILGPDLAQSTTAPLAEAASRMLGSAGMTLMLAGAICSMFGYQCGDMLSTPRSIYALARDGFLPVALARIHDTHRTPHAAIWTHATLVFVLAVTSTFETLAIMGNVGLLLLYLLACGAAIALVRRGVRTADAPFAMPGWWLAPIVGAALIAWILSAATRQELLVTAGVLACATLAYAIRNRAQ